MQYALLFYNEPSAAVEAMPAARREAWYAEMRAWRDELERAGVFRTGLRLAGIDSATSLRGQGGDVLVVDGPFAETKEMLAGFVLVECADLDEALAWTRRCPILQF